MLMIFVREATSSSSLHIGPCYRWQHVTVTTSGQYAVIMFTTVLPADVTHCAGRWSVKSQFMLQAMHSAENSGMFP